MSVWKDEPADSADQAKTSAEHADAGTAAAISENTTAPPATRARAQMTAVRMRASAGTATAAQRRGR